VNPSEPFIRRPVATSLLMVAIALFGAIAYRVLPVADLPQVDYPTLSVGASLPGADPKTMAASVASPLERQFTTIAGLDTMVSSSSAGYTNVTLQFDLDRDIDGAAVDVQTAIAEVMPLLPPGMPAPPSFRKVNPAAQPMMTMGLKSKTLPLSAIDDIAENVLAPSISMLSGVSQVNVVGGAKYAVRVQVDPDKLRAQHMGFNEIDQALQNWNVNLPTGQLFGPKATFNIRAAGQLMDAGAFRPMVVAYRNGAPVRLEHVANVIDSVENTKNAAWLYVPDEPGTRAVGMAIMRQPGTNLLEVTDAVRRLLPEIQKRIPPSIHLDAHQRPDRPVREAFADIQLTMLVTLALVIGVIYLFLHNGSATLIPALALPFSLLGTFAVMQLLHFSLNSLSMMALVLSVGFVVDDAIVMLENIVRHMEGGEKPFQAALSGSKEIGFTILTMTTSLAAVFIPVLFMTGVMGRLLREFAVTITAAILISGVVSVTLTPMLASRLLADSSLAGSRGLASLMERLFGVLFRGYERSLRLVLRHRPAMLVLFVGVIAVTARMFTVIPTGFIPDQDNDTLNIVIRGAQGTSFDQMVEYAQPVADMLHSYPYIAWFVGAAGGGNTVQFVIDLTPRKTRPLTAQQIAADLRPRLSRFPGFRAFVSLPPALAIGGRMGNQVYSLRMQGFDTDELYQWGPKLEAAIMQLPEVVDVSTDMEQKSPRINLAIDRDKAAVLALNASQIEDTLTDGFSQRWSSTIYGAANQYRVLLELDPRFQMEADGLHSVSFKSSQGALVPLDSVIRFEQGVGPQSISHSGQLPSVSVSFGLRPGVSLGVATAKVRELADRVLPASVSASFEGSAKLFEDSTRNLGLLLFVAIGVVYIVLGALYESYIHPITILSGLPSAGLGALATLYLFGSELNLYSFVGLVMLVGIVKKNAIMQIDFALESERRYGKDPVAAILEGCLIRFRPIMMTTMAALLGSIPIALGYGSGGEARRPLGLAVLGGLLVSQVITLYLTPVVYTYMASLFPARRISPAT
jgi:HAE1 family hydrophobic/amphiphilic exporter-1